MKKRILSILMTLALLVSFATMFAVNSAAAHPFTDVPSWADEYVTKVYEKGIMQGTGGTTFGSDATLTREQLVVTLYRISGSTVTGTLESLGATFADAADISDWAYSAVEWASKEGITAGVKEGDKLCFKPKNDVTRQEAAKFFVTFIDYMNLNAPTDNVANLKDIDTVASWAREYVDRCVAAGIINGDGNGNFAPTGKTTRVAAAKMLACLPEKSTTARGPETRVNVDPKDPTPQNIGKINLDGYTTPDGLELSYAHLIGETPTSTGEYRATGMGSHGWHETRVARTEYGTYVVYANDEWLEDEYLQGNHGYVRATSQFILVKITSDGYKIVLKGEYLCHPGSCSSNVLVGEDGIIYITTFSTGEAFNAECAVMKLYTFDTKTDTLVSKCEDSIPFQLQDTFKTHGYGYYQPVYDGSQQKIYAFYAAGEWPGYYSWFIYDIRTNTWDRTSYLIETPYRASYMNIYPDGKGGVFFVSQRNAPTWGVEDSYDGSVRFISDGYIFDGLYLFIIPDVTKEEYRMEDIYIPDYSNEKEFPKTGGLTTPAHVAHYNGGLTYLDSKGNLFVIYSCNGKYRYVVYDTLNDFKKARSDKELTLKDRSDYEYQFAMAENTNGEVFLVAINTKKAAATLEMYKLDMKATKINTSILNDSNGAASVQIPVKGGGYLKHNRLAFTGTRNNSVQDNTLTIVTFDSGADTDKTIDDQDISKIGTLIYSGGGGANSFYYYTIVLPH